MFKRVLKLVSITFILLLLLVGGYRYYQHQKFYPSTDDAYVQANVINVAAQVSGEVSAVFVQNQQYVQKGNLLFSIDPTPFIAALAKAKANLNNTIQQVNALEATVASAQALVAQRKAELTNTAKQTRRIVTLVDQKLYSAAQGDNAVRNLAVAKAAFRAANSQLMEAQQKLGKSGNENAQIQAAKAAVKQAEIQLSYTKVYAPVSGQVTQFTLRKGTGVTAYRLLFSIVDNSEWWVSANFKETNLERIHPGQKAEILIDMYPHHHFAGHIVSIAPGSGATFALLPAENATGNWVKVTQRFPVRITLPPSSAKYPFRIGSSCTATIDTHTLP